MKPALIFVLVALGGMVLAEAFVIRRQEARLRELESAVARQGTPEAAVEILRRAGLDPASAALQPGNSAAGDAGTRAAVDAAVAERTRLLEGRLASLEKNVADGTVARGGGASDEALNAMVDKKLDEKLAGQKKGGLFGDDKKRPLNEISQELGLTGLQEDQMSSSIEVSQKAIFDVICTPRNDGTNVLDDIIVAMKDPDDPQGKMQAAFMQLFTAKIPGSEETYLARIMAEKQALTGEFRKILSEDQMKKFERSGQDPTEIQTGYDPFSEYVMRKTGENK